MSIRKRTKANGEVSYQVRVAPFKSKTASSLKTAQRIERDLKERKELGDLWIEPAITLGGALDTYLDLQRATCNWRPNTDAFYARSRKFWEPLDDCLLPNLRRSEIEDRIAARARKHPRSAKNELEFAKAALRAAEARGQRFDRGILAIRPVRHQQRPGIALTRAELVEFQSYADEYIRRMIWLAGTTALRWGSLINMEDSWLDLELRIVHIPPAFNKSKRDLVVNLTGPEAQLFREQLMVRTPSSYVFPCLKGTRWASHGHFLKTAWEPTREAAGRANPKFAKLNFHDLRHTASSLMGAAGMNPTVAAARRGDSDGGEMFFKTYRHLYPFEIEAATEQFEHFLNADSEDEQGTGEGRI